jgi:hypothetical protein
MVDTKMKSKSSEGKWIKGFIERHKENLTVQMIDELVSLEEDGRKTKKYDENTQIPVGYLYLIFSPKRQDLREKYINGKEWFVINTKNNRVLGSVTFGMKIKGSLVKL